MFKIRTPNIYDIAILEKSFKDNQLIQSILKNKIALLTQTLIPHSLRFLPSIHLAIEEKDILGYVILNSLSKVNNCWEIKEVFVFDELRNKGIGEELLKYVLSLYGGFGIEHFLCEVDSQNSAALSLFHGCGFRRYAKVYFYEKEFVVNELNCSLLNKDFALKTISKNDLKEIEKLELSTIPADLRFALSKSKEYFKEKNNSFVVIDKARDLIIGWSNIERLSNDNYFIELLISPGWDYLYENFLNTIICDLIAPKTNKLKLTVKVTDYLTELTGILSKGGFLPVEIKELLVKTVWQKVKERKTKSSKIGAPYIAPT